MQLSQEWCVYFLLFLATSYMRLIYPRSHLPLRGEVLLGM